MTIRSNQITALILGDREYELVQFLEPGETSVFGDEMVKRAERLDANVGEEDGQYILAHQSEIPAELRGKIVMVFAAWRNPDNPRLVAYSNWHDGRWVQGWSRLDGHWGGHDQLVRRRLPTGEAGK